ncbi:hypothetical protein AVEN_180685-1 [Araneus ventricosus]|uniref:Uncharacterized protein n=2 Tax=Araneus ventricosus TaxID=182803 RepID=A0A4Y2LRI8_ARAVE|nr:hypothetical protein AVEN_180685-1 [Araneus ventricosus]
MFTSPRHDHTDEQHRPCVASPFKSEQKRAVNNAQKGYIVEEGDFPERPVTRSGSEINPHKFFCGRSDFCLNDDDMQLLVLPSSFKMEWNVNSFVVMEWKKESFDNC